MRICIKVRAYVYTALPLVHICISHVYVFVYKYVCMHVLVCMRIHAYTHRYQRKLCMNRLITVKSPFR